MALLVAPLLGVVLTIAAQIGVVARIRVARSRLSSDHLLGQRVAKVLLLSVVLVNLVTIAADLQAGAAGIGLLAGIGSSWVVLPLGLALVALLLIGRSDEVVAVLRYVLVGFLAFGVAVSRSSGPAPGPQGKPGADPVAAARGSGRLPRVARYHADRLRLFVGDDFGGGRGAPREAAGEADGPVWPRLGAVIGAVSTAVILWFMLITSAATLGMHHETIATAEDAAQPFVYSRAVLLTCSRWGS